MNTFWQANNAPTLKDLEESSRVQETEVLSTISYFGFADPDVQNPSTSDAVWLVRQNARTGSRNIQTYASEDYDQIWDDRVSLFGPVPFSNQISINFDGIDDVVDIGTPPVLEFGLGDPFSFSLWFKSHENSSAHLFGYSGSGTTSDGWQLRIFGSQGDLRFVQSSGGSNRLQITKDDLNVNDSIWHHFAITRDTTDLATGLTVYFDGILLTAGVEYQINNDALTNVINYGSARCSLAARGPALNQNTYRGNIDEVSIFNVELTPTEVALIYNSGIAGVDLNLHPQSANLQAWWRMGDGDTFPTILDNSNVGNNLNGTMINMLASDLEGTVPE